jgi:predicted secreted protein
MPCQKHKTRKSSKSNKNNSFFSISTITEKLQAVLSPDIINEIGKDTKMFQRIRKIKPFYFLLVFIETFAGRGEVKYLSTLLSTYNYNHDESIAYKAWHTHLDKEEFPKFMLKILNYLIEKLTFQIFKGKLGEITEKFDDILIQDGTGFAVHSSLKDVFKGRFSQNPAAIGLHLCYSIFKQSIFKLTLTSYSESEHNCLPEPESMRNTLSLYDRGYVNYNMFENIQKHGGYYICRLRGNINPKLIGGKMKLREFKSQLGGKDFDVDVKLKKNGIKVRIVGIKHPDSDKYWYLATNLSREEFSGEVLRKFYHYRWQIEIVFKQWKSYTNLKKFNTRKSNIAEGLVWANLITHVVVTFLGNSIKFKNRIIEISLFNIVKSSHQFMRDLITSLSSGDYSGLNLVIKKIERFLIKNKKRRNLKRDQEVGALNIPLVMIEGGLK